MKIENCTADPRNLVTTLPSGVRVTVRLKPGEMSKDLDPKVIDILRQNKAVDLLFKQRLVRVVKPGEKPRAVEPPKPRTPSKAAVAQAETAKKEAKEQADAVKKVAKAKGKSKAKTGKLDIGV